MEAGRELDRLVAQTFGLPEGPYSTDRSAAMRAFDKFIEENEGCSIGIKYRGYAERFKWKCGIEVKRRGVQFFVMDAETAPLAICLTVLEATGVKVS